MEAGELFDKFYQEQVEKGTADGSVWEYKSDMEKLMVDYHNSQMEPFKKRLKKTIEYSLAQELFFVEKVINDEYSDQPVIFSGLTSEEILKIIDEQYPQCNTWIVYDLLVLDVKLKGM